MSEPITITATEALQRYEDRAREMKTYYDGLTPVERMLFLLVLEEIGKRLWCGTGSTTNGERD